MTNEFARDGRRGLIGMRGFIQTASNHREYYYRTIYDLNKQIIYSIHTEENICEKIDYPDPNMQNNCMPGYH